MAWLSSVQTGNALFWKLRNFFHNELTKNINKWIWLDVRTDFYLNPSHYRIFNEIHTKQCRLPVCVCVGGGSVSKKQLLVCHWVWSLKCSFWVEFHFKTASHSTERGRCVLCWHAVSHRHTTRCCYLLELSKSVCVWLVLTKCGHIYLWHQDADWRVAWNRGLWSTACAFPVPKNK